MITLTQDTNTIDLPDPLLQDMEKQDARVLYGVSDSSHIFSYRFPSIRVLEFSIRVGRTIRNDLRDFIYATIGKDVTMDYYDGSVWVGKLLVGNQKDLNNRSLQIMILQFYGVKQ